jgi:hypothetical protein
MGTRQGLRKLSPDLIDEASDETVSQVVRLMLAFVGTVAFCLLSLASPDVGLLTSNEKLTVPGAGPVSFFGFMLLVVRVNELVVFFCRRERAIEQQLGTSVFGRELPVGFAARCECSTA